MFNFTRYLNQNFYNYNIEYFIDNTTYEDLMFYCITFLFIYNLLQITVFLLKKIYNCLCYCVLCKKKINYKKKYKECNNQLENIQLDYDTLKIKEEKMLDNLRLKTWEKMVLEHFIQSLFNNNQRISINTPESLLYHIDQHYIKWARKDEYKNKKYLSKYINKKVRRMASYKSESLTRNILEQEELFDNEREV